MAGDDLPVTCSHTVTPLPTQVEDPALTPGFDLVMLAVTANHIGCNF